MRGGWHWRGRRGENLEEAVGLQQIVKRSFQASLTTPSRRDDGSALDGLALHACGGVARLTKRAPPCSTDMTCRRRRQRYMHCLLSELHTPGSLAGRCSKQLHLPAIAEHQLHIRLHRHRAHSALPLPAQHALQLACDRGAAALSMLPGSAENAK